MLPRRLDFEGAAGELVGGEVDGDTVTDNGAAVDEDVFDAGGELAGLGEGGVVGDGVGIEDDDVSEIFFANEASVGDLEAGGRTSGELGDDFFEGEEFLIADERTEEPIGGAEHAGMDVAFILVDGIGANEATVVLQHGPAPGIFSFVEDEEDGETFLDQ